MVGKLNLDLGEDYAFNIRRARAVAEAAQGGVAGQQGTVFGPYMTGGLEYWTRTPQCQIGFDISNDEVPDVWSNLDDVSGLTPQQRATMRAKLRSQGCDV